MSKIIPFVFEDHHVRVVADDRGEPLFVAKDLMLALGYADVSNVAKSIAHVPDEWKGREPIPTPGGKQETAVLTEQGMYFFLGRSDKPSALPMQKFVASDVLPSIRKTGAYLAPGATLDSLSPEIRSQIGGIVKAVVGKQVSDALTTALPALVAGAFHAHALPICAVRGMLGIDDGVAKRYPTGHSRARRCPALN